MFKYYKTFSETNYAVKLREEAGDMDKDVGKNLASEITGEDTSLVYKWYT